MPRHIKLTGDTHLPDAESDIDIEEGAASMAHLAHDRNAGRAYTRRHAGLLRSYDEYEPPAQRAGDEGEAAAASPVVMIYAPRVRRPFWSRGVSGKTVAMASLALLALLVGRSLARS
jgi:hypothetical protein